MSRFVEAPKTSEQQLISLHSHAVAEIANLINQTVKLELQVRSELLARFTINILFFHKGDNCGVTLYPFYSFEENKAMLNAAIAAIKKQDMAAFRAIESS